MLACLTDQTVQNNLCVLQAASWLDAAPFHLEDFLQDRKHLTELLTNQSCRLGHATTTGPIMADYEHCEPDKVLIQF